MKHISLVLILLITSTVIIRAENYDLDLNKSIELAKKKSLSMMQLDQDLKMAGYNLKAATSRFKTHITLNFVTPSYTETIRQYEDSSGISFYPVKQMNYQGNLNINQPLPTDGYIYIRSGVSNYDDYFTDLRSTYLNTRLGFVQPIDAFYGYNAIKSSFKQAKLAFERANKQYKREELNLIYSVSSAFYNLLSVQKSTEIARLDLDRQTDAYQTSKNKFEAGLIREVDALQMEVDLAEAQNNHALALVNQNSSMNYFKELVGLELSDSVALSSNLNYEPVIVDVEKAVQMAIANRLEIREQEIQIELNKLNIKQQQAAGLPQADLTAYYEKAGYSSQDINTNFGQSIQNSYTDFLNRPQNFGLGVNISIPLFDWGENRALVNAAKSRLKQTELQKKEVERSIEREVRNLVADLNSSLSRLQLLEKNLVVAQKSFEITRQRFSDGDIDSQSLALERNRLNNAYNSHLRAYINYQLLLADIMRKTFYDFRSGEIVK